MPYIAQVSVFVVNTFFQSVSLLFGLWVYSKGTLHEVTHFYKPSFHSRYKKRWLNDGLVWCLVYIRVYETSAGCLRSTDPSLGVSQLFWWLHKGTMTSQSTDLIYWHIYPCDAIEIDEHVDTCDKMSMTPQWLRSTLVKLCLLYYHIDWTGILVDAIHYFAPQITAHCVAIRRCATAQ